MAEVMISKVIRSPGTSLGTELRFRDASGTWRLMDVCMQNVFEAPGEASLVGVSVRDGN